MFTIEFNDDQISLALNRVDGALGDMSEIMHDLAALWLTSTQDRMKRGEQPDGTPFAPRSPVTLERYAAQGIGFGEPLWYTGHMNKGIFPESGPDFFRIASNEPQSAVMQFGASQGAFGSTAKGGPIPWGDIPARPFLGISDEDETNMMAELAEWLENAASGAN